MRERRGINDPGLGNDATEELVIAGAEFANPVLAQGVFVKEG